MLRECLPGIQPFDGEECAQERLSTTHGMDQMNGPVKRGVIRVKPHSDRGRVAITEETTILTKYHTPMPPERRFFSTL